MDRVEQYRAIIKRVITEEAQAAPSDAAVESLAICDTLSDNYLVMLLGWEDTRRVIVPLIHIRLKDGKVWIEADGTEDAIASILVDAGIPKEEIVLAFYHPNVRPDTEFAVA